MVNLHNQIMNIQVTRYDPNFTEPDRMMMYKAGHRDARHAAAELASAHQENHARLVGLIDAALKCDLLDDKDWKRKARTLLAQLDGE